MTGKYSCWGENKRHTKLYVFGEEKMCKTENHCLINKAHYKNVYILDIKQKTFKVLQMAECKYFWKKTKNKQSCLNSKIFYSLSKTHDKYVYFWERKHKTYKVVFNIKIFAY